LILFGVAYLFKRMFGKHPVSAADPSQEQHNLIQPITSTPPAQKTVSAKKAAKEAELRVQINQYHTLPFIKTYRGIACIVLCAVAGLTLLFVVFGVVGVSAMIDVVLILTIAAFVGFGHRWAMIAGMVVWILEKIYQLTSSNPPSVVSIFFYSLAVLGALYSALRVENLRRKPQPIEIKTP